MPIRETLFLPDIQLSYLEWNQGKEPLVLLHGLADHALVWSNLGDYLAQRYHIVAPDLRGHGKSGKPLTNSRSHPTRHAVGMDSGLCSIFRYPEHNQ